jgi:hypothetical protein
MRAAISQSMRAAITNLCAPRPAGSAKPLSDSANNLALFINASATVTLASASAKATVWSLPNSLAPNSPSPASFCLNANGSVTLTDTTGTTLFYTQPGLPASLNLKAPYTMSISSNGSVTVQDDECTAAMTLNTPSSNAASTILAAEVDTAAAEPSSAISTTVKGLSAAIDQKQASGPGGCKYVTVWGQCGGKNCPDKYGIAPGQCNDAPYAGYCCLPYWTCERKHQWWVLWLAGWLAGWLADLLHCLGRN